MSVGAMGRAWAPMPLARQVQRDLDALSALTGSASLAQLSAAQLMGERALLASLTFGHRRSAGGSCRLLDAADGTLAVNLPRPSDWELVEAWLGSPARNWQELEPLVSAQTRTDMMSQARVLGLAVSAPGKDVNHPDDSTRIPLISHSNRAGRPRVVDLSSLWAGPLCTHLLWLSGAEVIKVESSVRPDGARTGPRDFYRLLNQGKRSVALDLQQDVGQHDLKRLITSADIVVEAARPRALRQIGLDAEQLVAERGDLTWISITGYGRTRPGAGWVGFGDDASAAAGLSEIMRDATGQFEFAGDAIADPITGVAAALAAWRSWRAGGCRLISMPLAHTAAQSLREELQGAGRQDVVRSFARWWEQALSQDPHRGIEKRSACAQARALGADTAEVLAELDPR